jgi:hypothetical protein
MKSKTTLPNTSLVVMIMFAVAALMSVVIIIAMNTNAVNAAVVPVDNAVNVHAGGVNSTDMLAAFVQIRK